MQDFPALINDPWAIGIIVAQVGIGTPFFALLFSQIFNIEKLKDIQNLAYSLGATKFDVFRRTTLPILLLKSRHQIILSFIFVFGSFEIPSILGQHTPEMISVLAIRKMGLFEIGQKPEAFVVAFLYCLVVIGILAFSFKVDKK
jgi:putative spermidine/putrescine transport system permease protein